MKKKNIVVILCDQLRKDFLSCYGFKGLHTPNIDRLANDGVLFENAFTASPVCAPGRACMMTGRYVSDHQVFTNDVPFRDGLEYLAERFNKLGYQTGAFGKLHHFPAKDTKGFHTAFQMEENRLKDQDDYFIWLHQRHPEVTNIFNQKEDGSFAYERDSYYEEYIADKAKDFIKSTHQKGQNMFAWISFQGPHPPFDTLDEVQNADEDKIPSPKQPSFNPKCEVPLYRKVRENVRNSEETQQARAHYARLGEEIDDKIGEIITLIHKNGDYEDTLFIFSSDHGDLLGDYSMWQKGPFPYRAQLEIPLILTHSSYQQRGVTSEILTGNLDIGATALQEAGDEKPFGYSRSISTMLSHPEEQRNYVYSEFCDSIKIISDKKYIYAYYPFSGQQDLFAREEETQDLSRTSSFLPLMNKNLKRVIDNMVLAHGIKIEAQDLTPQTQKGIREILPHFEDDIPLVYPIAHQKQRALLEKEGLDSNYNEFCRLRKITRAYGTYWTEK